MKHPGKKASTYGGASCWPAYTGEAERAEESFYVASMAE